MIYIMVIMNCTMSFAAKMQRQLLTNLYPPKKCTGGSNAHRTNLQGYTSGVLLLGDFVKPGTRTWPVKSNTLWPSSAAHLTHSQSLCPGKGYPACWPWFYLEEARLSVGDMKLEPWIWKEWSKKLYLQLARQHDAFFAYSVLFLEPNMYMYRRTILMQVPQQEKERIEIDRFLS
jgi:hypothetical protein